MSENSKVYGLRELYMNYARNKKSSDIHTKLDSLRQLGLAVLNKSLESHPNDATCTLLEQNLQEYSDLVSEDPLAYTLNFSEMWADVGLEERPLPNWETSHDKFSISKIKANSHDCVGKFEDCKYSEITDEELDNIFSTSTSTNSERNNSRLKPEEKNDFNFSPNASNKRSAEQDIPETIMKTEFRTGLNKPCIVNIQKPGNSSSNPPSCVVTKKPLRSKKFVSPMLNTKETTSKQPENEWLKNIDPRMIAEIESNIMDNSRTVSWDDISGLEYEKTTITEAVIWPFLRPDYFTGLRRPPKGILLFGPPGTGKTLLGKCIASQSNSTFFCISASSLTSKFVGDGEKLVKTLFSVALAKQPAVIFIDEIDSLLSQRSTTEHESSRRLKTEFLISLDGVTTSEDDRVLIVGATNRPQELDEAARRRFVKRLYIPLPEHSARVQIIQNLLNKERNTVTLEQINEIAQLTDGYSCADIKSVCQEASMWPLRSIGGAFLTMDATKIRPVNINDFHLALKTVRSSVSPNDLTEYINWNKIYGSGYTKDLQ